MIVLNGQSLFDIAVQSCGSAEAAFEIAAMNDMAITDDLSSGQEVTAPNPSFGGELQRNAAVVNYYRTNEIVPATGLEAAAGSNRYVDEFYVVFNYIENE